MYGILFDDCYFNQSKQKADRQEKDTNQCPTSFKFVEPLSICSFFNVLLSLSLLLSLHVHSVD
jgi:hypothetical protein